MSFDDYNFDDTWGRKALKQLYSAIRGVRSRLTQGTTKTLLTHQ